MGLEELIEDRLVGEVELVHDLLDGQVGILEHVLRLQDDEVVDPVRRRAPGGLLDEFGEVFRRQAQLVGVEGHSPL